MTGELRETHGGEVTVPLTWRCSAGLSAWPRAARRSHRGELAEPSATRRARSARPPGSAAWPWSGRGSPPTSPLYPVGLVREQLAVGRLPHRPAAARCGAASSSPTWRPRARRSCWCTGSWTTARCSPSSGARCAAAGSGWCTRSTTACSPATSAPPPHELRGARRAPARADRRRQGAHRRPLARRHDRPLLRAADGRLRRRRTRSSRWAARTAARCAAYLLPTPLARQLRPGSELLAELAAARAGLHDPLPRGVEPDGPDDRAAAQRPARPSGPHVDEFELCDVGHLSLPDRRPRRCTGWPRALARSDHRYHPVRRGRRHGAGRRRRSVSVLARVLTAGRPRHDTPARDLPPHRGPATFAPSVSQTGHDGSRVDPDRPCGLPDPATSCAAAGTSGSTSRRAGLGAPPLPKRRPGGRPRTHDAPTRRRDPRGASSPGATDRVVARPGHGRSPWPQAPPSRPARRWRSRCAVSAPRRSPRSRSSALLPVARGHAHSGRARLRRRRDRWRPAPPRSAWPSISTPSTRSTSRTSPRPSTSARSSPARPRSIDAALSCGAPEAHLFGDEVFVRPTTGRLTSVFGARWGVAHNGIDIANTHRHPDLRPHRRRRRGGRARRRLRAVGRAAPPRRHARACTGTSTGCSCGRVRRCAAGEEIAEIGNRGQSTGPHLHLEIWDADGTKLNPIPWLKRHGIDY